MNIFEKLYIVTFNKISIHRDLISVVFLLGFLAISAKGFSQEQASIWYFGDHAGLDFNSDPPVTTDNSAMNAGEGCASISDENGNLLFYTNGVKVYNQNHQLMENGDDLLGSNSSSQSSIIIPKPGSNYIYYLFTTNSFDGGGFDYGLNFYEINMLSNSGLGSVVSVNGGPVGLPPSEITPLFTPVTEKLTATYAYDNESVWVVAHGSGPEHGQDFIAYKVTEDGVNTTPVVSSVGRHYNL